MLAELQGSSAAIYIRRYNKNNMVFIYGLTVGVLMVLGALRRVLPLPDSTTARSAAIFSADLYTERVNSD